MTSLLGEPGGGSLLGEPGGCDWYIGLRFNVPEIKNITLFCCQKHILKCGLKRIFGEDKHNGRKNMKYCRMMIQVIN